MNHMFTKKKKLKSVKGTTEQEKFRRLLFNRTEYKQRKNRCNKKNWFQENCQLSDRHKKIEAIGFIWFTQ